MKIRAKDKGYRLSLPVRRRDAEDGRSPTGCWPRRTCSSSTRPEAALQRPDRRRGGEGGRSRTTPDNAIEALLAGKPVPVEKTRVFGCSTKWSDKREDARKALEKWDEEPVTLGRDRRRRRWPSWSENDTKKLLVINVWATWCGPCVAELPEFVTMNRMYRGRDFQLVTISLDDPEKKDAALKVLKEKHVAATNYLVRTEDRDKFAEALDKEWPGPVPYTLVIAPGGKVIYRKAGAIDPLEVRRAIVGHLGRTY